jgi:hypothetical protein
MVTEQIPISSRRRLKLSLLLAIVAFHFGDGVNIYAQSFLKDLLTKSPGALTKPHAELDNIQSCITCHKNRLGGDVTTAKCVDCHEEFKARLNAKGFHKDKPDCKSCHTDHKGTAFSIFAPKDWRKDFDHDDTDYNLLGKHASVDCEKCHTSYRKHYKTKESTTSRTYLDAPNDCYTCHKNVYEHKFTKKEFLNCTQCHSPNIESWKKLARKLQFDHSRTEYPLEGLHVKIKCNDCHKPDEKKKRVTTFAPLPFAQCTNCHADPHKGSFGTDCTTCHSVYRKWNDIIPSKEGKKASIGKNPKILKGFDHSRTKFALKGYHQAVACEGCHPDASKQKDKFKVANFKECSDCHGFPHKNQFEKKSCEDCHTTDRHFLNSTFDIEKHNKTKFQLTGKHQVLDCNKCHFTGVYEQLPSKECSDCHRNPHDKRQIDKECSFCHVTTTFSWIKFDHNQNTKFDLTGKHRSVACTSCHVNEIFRDMPATNKKPNCQGCHEDPHGNSMPNECADCHRTEGFKIVRKFEHEKIGHWTLIGRHSDLSCQKCHPKHLLRDYKVQPTEKNLRATDCGNCHFDIHRGAFGKNCESCHSNDSFAVDKGVRVHDLGFFKLEGYHDRLGCNDCHRSDTNLQGIGIVCGNCHKKNDVHLGKLGMSCGDCHGQTAWLPSKFKHNQTGFRLNGAHRFVACQDCHKNQIYEGLPNDCFFCHSKNYLSNSRVDLHHTNTVADCGQCHSEVSWLIKKRDSMR